MVKATMLAQQVIDLEKTVRELRSHMRSLEAQVGLADGARGRADSWWRILWRRGGGAGRQGRRPGQFRENKRRTLHALSEQQRLHCA